MKPVKVFLISRTCISSPHVINQEHDKQGEYHVFLSHFRFRRYDFYSKRYKTSTEINNVSKFVESYYLGVLFM